jgi:hypothetical protein
LFVRFGRFCSNGYAAIAVRIVAAKAMRSQSTGVPTGGFRGGAGRAGRLARVGEYFSRPTLDPEGLRWE